MQPPPGLVLVSGLALAYFPRSGAGSNATDRCRILGQLRLKTASRINSAGSASPAVAAIAAAPTDLARLKLFSVARVAVTPPMEFGIRPRCNTSIAGIIGRGHIHAFRRVRVDLLSDLECFRSLPNEEFFKSFPPFFFFFNEE